MARTVSSRTPRARGTEKTIYSGLLVMLLVAYVLTVAAPGALEHGAGHLAVAVFAVLLVGVGQRVRQFVGGWAGIAVLAIVAAGLGGGLSAAGVDGAVDIITALLMLGAAVATVDRLLTAPEITVDGVIAALSIYLLLAFAFSASYSAIQDISGEGFFAADEFGNRSDFLYFSVVTLTTLGYGDLVSAGSLGRGLSALEALTGQLFLGTVVARFVGLLRTPQRTGQS